MKKEFFIITLTVCMLGCQGQNEKQKDLSADDWKEDLQYLSRSLRVAHPNLFHRISEKDFDAEIENLNKRIPSLQSYEVIFEFARLTALIGELHTGMFLHRLPRRELSMFQAYPIRFYLFEDGLFVQAVDSENSDIVGMRVIKIGKVNAQEALKMVSKLISADNPMWVKRYGPTYLGVAEVLHWLDISESRSEVGLTLEDMTGKKKTVKLTARPLQELLEMFNPLVEPAPNTRIATMRKYTSSPPLWLKDQRNRYWMEYLQDSKSLYIQINVMRDEDHRTMEQFFERALNMYDSLSAIRLIIDIRQNNGGDHLALPLVHGIIKRPALNQEGKLFVIIGRGTVSAGQNLATLLEIHTNVVFVGEPTSSKPNQYGVLGTFALPKSNLLVWHSQFLVQDSDPGDYRPWLEPDVISPLSSGDYRENRDPSMDAILTYEKLPSLVDTLEKAYVKGGLDDAIKIYQQLGQLYRKAGRSTEEDLRRFGYLLFFAKNKKDDAITVLELNAKEHPDSYRVFDRLGNIYLRAGNRSKGIKNYRLSIQLNPENEHAKRVVAFWELVTE